MDARLRDLPHNDEFEQQVLGGVLVSIDPVATFAVVAASLDKGDFYSERHRAIFEAMAENNRTGKPIDFISLVETIKQQGNLEKAGNAGYLIGLSDQAVTDATIGYYIKRVGSLSQARNLYRTFTQIAQSACDPAVDVTEIVAAAYVSLETVGQKNHGSSEAILDLAALVKMYESHVSNLDVNRFKTGYEELDAIIKGVSPGETLFITAYSGLFKSALLQNLLLGGCERTGLHHMFFSLEMPATRVFERSVQIALSRYTYNIESEFHHHNRDNRGSTMLDLASKNVNKLLVCETPGLGLDKIEHYTRLARSKYGSIGAVGIDYMGLMSAAGARSEYDRISAVAEGSKHLAKRLNVPVIVLTQINRSAALSGEVDMHSAKGSGAIEASADYMLAMTKNKTGQIELKVVKNRNGEAGARFDCDISKSFLRFENLTVANDLAEIDAARGKKRARKSNMEWTSNDGPNFDD